jgi:hypothetical protein
MVRLFGGASSELSLCVHGNDHDGPELGPSLKKPDSIALVQQALRRAVRFERRTGIPVDRVMVPPHEELGEVAARALLACGFEATCTTRPHPWAATSLETPWLTRPPRAGPLVGWSSVDIVAGGLPVLLRAGFSHSREDLVLRAFLGQPLILYGHHDVLRDGHGVFADAAAAINRLGDVRWSSLAAIARGSVQTRRHGDTLDVRMLARHVRVDVPAGIAQLRIDAGELTPPLPARLRVAVGNHHAEYEHLSDSSTAFLKCGGPGPLTLALEVPSARVSAARPSLRLRCVARRLATETRDRLQAVLT